MNKIILYVFLFLIPLRNIVEKIPNLFNIEGLGATHILFLLAFIASILTKNRDDALETTNLTFPVVLYLLYLLFSSVRNIESSSLMYQITAWKDQLLLMSVYFIIIKSFSTSRDIYISLIIMCCANLYMDVYFWRWVRWYSLDTYADKLKFVNGTFGTTGGANEWAAFFSSYTPVLLSVIPTIRQFAIKIFCIILLIGNLFVIMFSFSRGAYLAFIVSIMWYIFHEKKIFSFVVIIIVIVGYSSILPKAVVERIEMTSEVTEFGEIEDQDVQSRLAMWDISVEMFKSSPLIGHGYKSFRYEMWNNPHNQHLSILAELGVVGYLLVLLIYIIAYFEAGKLKARTTNEFARRFALGVQLATISLFIASFFGDRWSYLALNGYYWVLLAMCYNLYALEQQTVPAHSPLLRSHYPIRIDTTP